MSNEWGPDFSRLTVLIIEEACQRSIELCDKEISEIIALNKASRTFANTIEALESAQDLIGQAAGQYGFMAYVSDNEDIRNTARDWEAKLEQYLLDLSFREDIYQAIQEYGGNDESLDLEQQRLHEHILRDYRRSGFELPKKKREELRVLLDRLIELGVTFQQNINEYEDAILIEIDELEGLPQTYIEGLQKEHKEGGQELYRISLDYPELHPFLANAKSAEARKAIFLKDQLKGGDGNVIVLEEALQVRKKVAHLLGYKSWAEYILEIRMAKNPQRVSEFLTDLEEKIRPKAQADRELMGIAKQEDSGEKEVNIWDWRYCHNLLMESKYSINEFEVAEYFQLDACLKGLFDICQELFDVKFIEVPDAKRWHKDVLTFDVTEANDNKVFARFHMDLFPRPNKYGHAAAFTLRSGRVLKDGSYQRPLSAIVANFTKPTDSTPSLLRHSEVVTLFHEFGHILHQTLTKSHYLRFSGTRTERDFVEAPSQMFENWVWHRDVLKKFAFHFKTKEAIPEKVLDSMIAARQLSSGVTTQRQLFFANLDFKYHTENFTGNSTETARELHAITGFPFPEGTHFQSGFGHLFGYDAGYYGYLWSQVFGEDMYTRFAEAGPLNKQLGSVYRETILERGGSVDGDTLVKNFLGREPNNKAFLRKLGV